MEDLTISVSEIKLPVRSGTLIECKGESIYRACCSMDDDTIHIVETVKSESPYSIEVKSLFGGLDFIRLVQCQKLLENQGRIVDVIVDGRKTNLGFSNGVHFAGGSFLVNAAYWYKLCRKHDVYVNWSFDKEGFCVDLRL